MVDNQSIIAKNVEVLRGMIDQVKKRRRFTDENKTAMKKDWYIRVASNSLRAVSLNNETPLREFAKNGRKGEVKEILLKDFKKGKPDVPWKSVPERRIQCWLIKYALTNLKDMKPVLLPHDNSYEKLLFCLDEVTLYRETDRKPVRCDILAAGIHGKNAFPVIIEIKSIHQLTGEKNAVEELKRFCKIIENHPEELKALLQICIGQADIPIVDPEHIEKMIIWNKENGISHKTSQTLQKEKIKLLEYQWKIDFTPTEIKPS